MATRIVVLLTFKTPGGWFTKPRYTICIVDGDLDTMGTMTRTTLVFKYSSEEEFTKGLRGMVDKLYEDQSCQFMQILDVDRS